MFDNTKKRTLFLLIGLIFFPGVLLADPYTAWEKDYTGSESHTIALWKFDNFPGFDKNSYKGSENPNYYPVVDIHIDNAITEEKGKFETGFLIKEPIELIKDNPARAFSIGFPQELFNGSAISVEVWYRTPDVVDIEGYLFDKMYISKSGVRLYFLKDKLIFDIGNGEAIASLSILRPLLEPNTWYHFAATYENRNGDGIQKLYLNGELIGEAETISFGDLDAGERPWSIGNRSASSYFPLFGTYDNFRISDTAYEYSVSE